MSSLTLKEMPLIKNWLEKLDSPASEYSFANLYLFRDVHDYSLETDYLPLIRGKTREGDRFIFPLTKPYLPYMELLKENEFLFPITELDGLENYPHTCVDRDRDYVYEVNKLKLLPGRKLASRRNLLHQFENTIDPRIETLTPDLVKDALTVLEKWHNDKEGDYESCKEALILMEDLGLFGVIVYEDTHPLGFVLGEMQDQEHYLMHFAKSDHEQKGITPFLYQTVASRFDDKVKWMNLEPDLGIEELAHAKEAYAPDLLLEKFRIYRKKKTEGP